MTNDAPDPNAAPAAADDAWRFKYSLTGWAHESHGAAVYSVAFCGRAGAGGGAAEEEEEEEEEKEEGGEGEFPLDRVFASAGSRRLTVYYAPSLPPPPPATSDSSPSDEDEEAGGTAAEKQQQLQRRQQQEQQQEQRQEQREQQQRQLPFVVLQTYVDAAADEEFYVCKWARRLGGIESSKKKRAKGGAARKSGGAANSDNDDDSDKKKKKKDLPLLLAGGRRGTLRVIDPSLGGLLWTARGHGGSINDISVHPTRPALALTASRDQSIRLWNLQSRCCAARFAGGDGAHVAEVLSVDWHPLDALTFVSCGFDSGVKVWSLEGVAAAVEESFGGAEDGGSGSRKRKGKNDLDLDDDDDDDDDDETNTPPFAPFAPRAVPYPRFSSQRVHLRVADCVRWLGPGVLLSKTVDDRVLAWGVEGLGGLPCPLVVRGAAAAEVSGAASAAAAAAPSTASRHHHHPRLEQPRVRLLNSLRLSKADAVYFVRFSLDAGGQTLACGGREGRVCVFDPRRVPLPGGGPAEPRAKLRCAVPRGLKKAALKEQQKQQGFGGNGEGGEAIVRQTALSDDGSTLLASCDDGTIWRFDRPRRDPKKREK